MFLPQVVTLGTPCSAITCGNRVWSPRPSPPRRTKADDAQLKQVAERIKEETEGDTKEKVKDFVRHYRDWDANHKGVNDSEFWAICSAVGLEVPSKVTGQAKVAP